MGKSLYIAEKPSVAQEFAKALHLKTKSGDGYLEGKKYIVTWALGHLVELAAPEDYDKAFFADDLFIGDSISTGFSLYGVLDPKNVAAAVGYTPYKALNNAIDLGNGVTDSAYNYAVTMQPKRIFIMLGSNGITAAASMEESYRTLVEKLQANCPDSTVYILSVTPVTTDSSSAANAGIDNSMIRDFNKYLRDLASEKGVTYIDLYALLSDDNGYFLHEYAENDGLHFKGATYKVVLKYIEDII